MEAIKKEEGTISLTLTKAQASLLMAGISSGMINLEMFQKTSTIVFGDKSGEVSITGMLTQLSKIGFLINGELAALEEREKPKSDIVTASPLSAI